MQVIICAVLIVIFIILLYCQNPVLLLLPVLILLSTYTTVETIQHISQRHVLNMNLVQIHMICIDISSSGILSQVLHDDL